VIYSYNKNQKDALFLNIILVKNYIFRTDLLSILTSLADSQRNWNGKYHLLWIQY